MHNFYSSNFVVSDNYSSGLFSDVNSEDTLSNQQLFLLFSKVNLLLKECVDRLTLENDVIQLAILDLGSEIAGNTNRNKVIFQRNTGVDADGKVIDVKIDNDVSNKNFLCKCMDLGISLCTNNIIEQSSIINNLMLSRRVLENFVEAYLRHVRTYSDLCYKHASYLVDEKDDRAIVKDIIDLENKYTLDVQFGYGLVNYLSFRMDIIKSIYEKIYRAYSRFVFSISKSKANIFNDSVEEYFQYGSIGLMRAISSYDYLSPAKFSAFAAWWIKQQIFYQIKTGSSMIKMSSIVWQQYTKLESIKVKIESQYGPNFDSKLLVDASGLTEKGIDNIYSHVQTNQVKSLENQLIEEDGSICDVYDMADNSNETVEFSVELIGLLEELPFELKKIIYFKFGIV